MKSTIKILSFFLILFFSLLIYACASADKNFSETVWKAKNTNQDRKLLYAKNNKDGLYFNPWANPRPSGFFRFLGWKFSSKQQEYTNEEKKHLPKVVPNAKQRIEKTNGDFIMWVGHNTFLLRLDGTYWITDPILTQRAFIISRKTPPGISLKELNELTDSINIIITHNHYDHLDEDSIKALPGKGHDYVPMGIKNLFTKSLNRKQVTEMNWWQKHSADKSVRITCLPVQHWSKRIGQSDNTTLWASYMLVTSRHTIYIGGDSGYFSGYSEYGKLFKKIDYAFMPTTAYHPRWFMHYAHMNIEETLTAFNELGARYFIPTQWGTFQLGDEPAGYPSLDLQRNIEKQKLDKKRFLIMDIGEIRKI